MTPTLPTFAQALAFVGFVGASFVVLRYALGGFAERNQAWYAPPVLTIAGVIAAYVFLRLKLDTFFIWYLAFLAFVFLGWRNKSRPGSERLAALAKQEAARTRSDEDEVMRSYMMTRQLLSMGLLFYAAAFCLAFLYLFSKG